MFMLMSLCSDLVANGSVNSFTIAMRPSKCVSCLATATPMFAAICVHLSKGVMQKASDGFVSSAISAIADCWSKCATRTTGAISAIITVCVHLSEGAVHSATAGTIFVVPANAECPLNRATRAIPALVAIYMHVSEVAILLTSVGSVSSAISAIADSLSEAATEDSSSLVPEQASDSPLFVAAMSARVGHRNRRRALSNVHIDESDVVDKPRDSTLFCVAVSVRCSAVHNCSRRFSDLVTAVN